MQILLKIVVEEHQKVIANYNMKIILWYYVV
jgi:hypothetical protein